MNGLLSSCVSSPVKIPVKHIVAYIPQSVQYNIFLLYVDVPLFFIKVALRGSSAGAAGAAVVWLPFLQHRSWRSEESRCRSDNYQQASKVVEPVVFA